MNALRRMINTREQGHGERAHRYSDTARVKHELKALGWAIYVLEEERDNLSSDEKRHLRVLRLMRTLRAEERIPAADTDRLAAELAALNWALEQLEQWIQDDPLFAVEWRDPEFTDTASLQDILDLLGTAVSYKGELHEVCAAEFASSDEPGQTVRLTLGKLAPGERAPRQAGHLFAVDA